LGAEKGEGDDFKRCVIGSITEADPENTGKFLNQRLKEEGVRGNKSCSGGTNAETYIFVTHVRGKARSEDGMDLEGMSRERRKKRGRRSRRRSDGTTKKVNLLKMVRRIRKMIFDAVSRRRAGTRGKKQRKGDKHEIVPEERVGIDNSTRGPGSRVINSKNGKKKTTTRPSGRKTVARERP